MTRAELFQAATHPHFFPQGSADSAVNVWTKISEIKVIFYTVLLHTVFVQQFWGDKKLIQCVL